LIYRGNAIDGYQAELSANIPNTGRIHTTTSADGQSIGPKSVLAISGERTQVFEVNGAERVNFEETLLTNEELSELFNSSSWNRIRVVAVGTRISHFINDVLVAETTNNTRRGKEARGPLAFEGKTDQPDVTTDTVVQFRDIRLKYLSADLP